MKERIEVRLSGTGGQGLILAGMILSDAAVLEGKWAAQSQSFEPLSRGGSSRADVIIGSEPIDYPLVTEPDFLLVLDPAARETGPLGPEARVVVDGELGRGDGRRTIELPLTATARRIGSLRVTNMVSLGALAALTGVVAQESLAISIHDRSPKGFEALNLEAMKAGYELAHRDDVATGAPRSASPPSLRNVST